MVNKVHEAEDIHFRALRLLQADPTLQQRELAKALGLSLGKTNYCVRALIDKGMVKVQNFQSSKTKRAYAYLVTPAGIASKAALTARFLQRKMQEYERIKAEIESLKQEGVIAGTDPQTMDAGSSPA